MCRRLRRRPAYRLNEGPLQKEGQCEDLHSLRADDLAAASMKGPSRRRGNPDAVGGDSRNGQASMKGPSRRRGNVECFLVAPQSLRASMKGPSRRRGNRRS